MAMSELDPRLDGYEKWDGWDPFEENIGPFYFKDHGDGRITCAFVSDDRSINGMGVLHGGMLMSFADYALFALARHHIGPNGAVTLSFNADFTAPAGAGEFIEADGEVVHSTPGTVFVQGRVFTGDRTLLRFAGVLKKLKQRPVRVPHPESQNN